MRRKILCVSGTRAMSFLLETVLGQEYAVRIANNSFSAMYELKTGTAFDLIVIDVDAYEHDNWEFIQFIKTSDTYNLPIIVLATKEKGNAEIKIREAQVQKYFLKPFNPLDLTKAVKKMMTETEV